MSAGPTRHHSYSSFSFRGSFPTYRCVYCGVDSKDPRANQPCVTATVPAVAPPSAPAPTTADCTCDAGICPGHPFPAPPQEYCACPTPDEHYYASDSSHRFCAICELDLPLMPKQDAGRIPVSAARAFAEQHDLDRIIVIATTPDGFTHITTWGATPQKCKEAARAQAFWNGTDRRQVLPTADAQRIITAEQADGDDDGCPVGDPDCEGNNGDCHDACEAP